jgi:tRNA modification GTPase
MLVDLAGTDDDPSSLNRQMQDAAGRAIARAELILLCIGPDDHCDASVDRSGPTVVVRTKTDLASASPDGDAIVSAVTGEGLDDLRALIATRMADRAVSLAADSLALLPRHDAAMRDALDNIAEATQLVQPAGDRRQLDHPELIAAAMRAALDALGALAGDIAPDEVLGRIFATFCVGK